jgi:hypothetical protein
VATRPSQRPFNVSYYARNRAQEIDRVRTRQAATLEFLRELRRVPCADCGGTFEPYQMDFDHRDPAQKSFQVTDGRAMLMSRERLLAEVAKCDIVCANCHRIRTDRQRKLGTLRNGFQRKSDEPSPEVRRSREKFHRSRGRHRTLLDELKQQPCADCGGAFPLACMEFDHRDPTTKAGLVPQLTGRVGIAKLLEEIAKCDIVCANCHRKRTFLSRTRGSSSVRSERLPSKQDVAGSNPVSRSASQLRLIEEAAIRYAA